MKTSALDDTQNPKIHSIVSAVFANVSVSAASDRDEVHQLPKVLFFQSSATSREG